MWVNISQCFQEKEGGVVLLLTHSSVMRKSSALKKKSVNKYIFSHASEHLITFTLNCPYQIQCLKRKSKRKHKVSPCCRAWGHEVATPTSACSSWLGLCVAPGSRSAEDSGKRVWDLAAIRCASAAACRNRRTLPWRCGKHPARCPRSFWTCTRRRPRRRSVAPEKCPG